MVFFDDLVGRRIGPGRRPLLDQAYAGARIVRAPEPEFRDDMPIREEAIPVVRDGRALAVLTRHTNLATMRTPSRLELTYVATADALARMVASGDFPTAGAPTGQRRGAPRVGDGVIRLDGRRDGELRQPQRRLGDPPARPRRRRRRRVAGPDRHRRAARRVARSTRAWRWWSPAGRRGAPRWPRAARASRCARSRWSRRGRRTGAILLLRDVSELRRRERDLMTKDATIREIHHRVKNNLQTVAALLRMQSRRLPDNEARAALDEAVRRVGTIAIVHETLSHGFDETVDFDEVIARELAVGRGGGRRGRRRCAPSRRGTFGRLRAEDATSLAMIISELVHNAVEHGLAARGRDGAGRRPSGRSRTARSCCRCASPMTGRDCPRASTPAAERAWAPQIVTSLVQDLRGADHLGTGRSRAEPWCGSSRGSGRSRTSGRSGPAVVGVVR